MKWLSWIFIPINLFIARKLAIQRLARHNHDVFSFDMHDCFFPLPPHINVFLKLFFHFFCLLEHPDWETILGAMFSHLGSRCSDSSHSERYAMPFSPLSQKIQWICQLRSSTTCSLGASLSFATPIRAGIRWCFCSAIVFTATKQRWLKTIWRPLVKISVVHHNSLGVHTASPGVATMFWLMVWQNRPRSGVNFKI